MPGFDPMERSSAERKHFLGISKAGSRLLRYLLVEAAHTAVKNDDDLKRFYHRLATAPGPAKSQSGRRQETTHSQLTSCCAMRLTMPSSDDELSQLGWPDRVPRPTHACSL